MAATTSSIENPSARRAPVWGPRRPRGSGERGIWAGGGGRGGRRGGPAGCLGFPREGGGPGTGGRGGSEGRRGGRRAHPPPQKPRKLQLAGLSPGPEVFGRFYFGEWGGLASQGARPGERARAINAAWARGGLPAGLRPAAKEPRGTQAKEPRGTQAKEPREPAPQQS